MSKRKGLGRGLRALIPEIEISNELSEQKNIDTNTNKGYENDDINQVKMIKLKDITVNKKNARKSFDKNHLKNLAESINQYGIIQPLVLIEKDGKYEIVAGERRFRASKMAGLDEVPAIIKDLDIKQKDMISMIENIQREDLNPYEEARAYSSLMSEYSMTQNELGKVLGKSRTYIANIVRLLSLDDETIKELEEGKITSSQGRALLSIENLEERKKYLQLLINNQVTVNEIEKKVSKRKNKSQKDIFIIDIEEKLKEAFGTKVIVKKGKNKWNVNIEFSTNDQIEDFLNRYGLGE